MLVSSTDDFLHSLHSTRLNRLNVLVDVENLLTNMLIALTVKRIYDSTYSHPERQSHKQTKCPTSLVLGLKSSIVAALPKFYLGNKKV